MQSSLYVALSAQLSLQKRLETVAHNVANSAVTGFRAEEVRFETLVSRKTTEPVSFAASGRQYLSRTPGELTKTGDPLSVAIKGDAWFGIDTPAGQAYTRDGRFRMTPGGDLQTLNGYAVLDAGGAAIQIDPQGGPPAVSADGTITQAGKRAGVIGLFKLDDTAKIDRFENSGIVGDKPAIPMLDFSAAGMVQGFVENANVNPVAEISRLIFVQRAFDAVTATLSTAETSLQGAIRSLGSST